MQVDKSAIYKGPRFLAESYSNSEAPVVYFIAKHRLSTLFEERTGSADETERFSKGQRAFRRASSETFDESKD